MEFEFTAEVAAPPAKVWQVWTDVEAYPQWDAREEWLKLDTPFGEGATGKSKQKGNPENAFTISDVMPERGWTTTCALPGGELRMTHSLEQTPTGTTVTKRYHVTGPLTVLFRLWFAPRMKTPMAETFAALNERVTA